MLMNWRDASLKSFFLTLLLLVTQTDSVSPERGKCHYFRKKDNVTIFGVKCIEIEQVPCDRIPSTTAKL